MTWPYTTIETAPAVMWSALVSAAPVLTLEQAKLRAGLEWDSPDPRDELMTAFVTAATQYVEREVGLALLTQAREVYVDGDLDAVVWLPTYSHPLQTIDAITYQDTANQPQTVDPAIYLVDPFRARILLVDGAAWPTDRGGLPWVIRLTAGWADIAQIPAVLYQAVGALTAHFATVGRDVVSLTSGVAEVPYAVDALLSSYRPVRA